MKYTFALLLGLGFTPVASAQAAPHLADPALQSRSVNSIQKVWYRSCYGCGYGHSHYGHGYGYGYARPYYGGYGYGRSYYGGYGGYGGYGYGRPYSVGYGYGGGYGNGCGGY
jgi:hypothetical protein